MLILPLAMGGDVAGAFAQGWTDRFESERSRSHPADPLRERSIDDPLPERSADPLRERSIDDPLPERSADPLRERLIDDQRRAAAPTPRGPVGPCTALPGAPTPIIRFSTRLGEIVHHNTRSRGDLKSIQSKSGQRTGGVGPGWQPIGLTLTEIKLRTRINVSAQPISGGHVCARLASVEAEMGMDKIDVHVTSGYRPGTCQYHAVMDHEMRHVSVFRDAVNRHGPLARVRLEQMVRTLEPVVATDAKDAANRLRQRIERELESMFREMNRDIERRNQMLDTRESYEREQKRCSQW